MLIWGLSGLTHDAALSVLDDKQCLFAAHSERYSRKKGDKHIHHDLVKDALKASKGMAPDRVVWFERPLIKWSRQIYSREKSFWSQPIHPKAYLRARLPFEFKLDYVGHHLSHASAGYYTSPFKEALVLVIDAIGEWDTITLWQGRGTELKLVYKKRYPHSLGLFYSAMSARLGFRPNDEEYIFMGLSSYGDPDRFYNEIKESFFVGGQGSKFSLKHNLHRGCRWWRPDIVSFEDFKDVAAATQQILEDIIVEMLQTFFREHPTQNLVYMGGVALNCRLNARLAREFSEKNIWIFPNPGDAGSALGAALAQSKSFVSLDNMYLGHDIGAPKDHPEVVAQYILDHGVAGVAAGRAEYGPRALGNRSLLADPRLESMKDRLNEIKGREMFRPFAPIILDQYVNKYFDISNLNLSYMQYAVPCIRKEEIPSGVHVDGSSRVQVIKREQNPWLYEVLLAFMKRTNCPVLLNTSLNVKGEPIVNTVEDALRFQMTTNVKVFIGGDQG